MDDTRVLEIFFEAIEDDDVELVKFRLENDAKLASKCHPLCDCELCTKVGSIIPLINAVDEKGNTALHIAALHGCYEIVVFLLQRGAAVEIPNRLMHTQLHYACQYNHPLIVTEFLRLGAGLDVQDLNGNTPLHFCSSNGHVECSRILIARGADLQIQNARGNTSLHNAAQWGDEQLIKMLLNGTASRSISIYHS